jgi:hypothetical protein
MREYMDDVGGDFCLKSRPGEAAEFIVRLPMGGEAKPARIKIKNEFDTKDLV